MKSPSLSRRPSMTSLFARPAPSRRRVALLVMVSALIGAVGTVIGPSGAAQAQELPIPTSTTAPPATTAPAPPPTQPPQPAQPSPSPPPQQSPPSSPPPQSPPPSIPPDLPVVQPPADPNAPPPPPGPPIPDPSPQVAAVLAQLQILDLQGALAAAQAKSDEASALA